MRNPLDIMKIRTSQGVRVDPISNTFGMVRSHNAQAHQGWDLEAVPGTIVYAIVDGVITSGLSSSYGTWISLKFLHAGNTYFAFYAHLGSVLGKVQYESVREGARIAYTGRSGNAQRIPFSQAHLHFEIRTIEFPHPGSGLHGRIDPGQILGYQVYTSHI